MLRGIGRGARSGRAASGLLVAAVVAGGLAASLGAGYTVAQATLDDSSAYVTKGDSVAHINGESRRPDATSPSKIARNGERVETRVLPSGQVIAINQKTGVSTTLDKGTMRPTSTVRPTGAVVEPSDVVASGKGGWFVDFDGSSVSVLDKGVRQEPIKIDGRPDDAAPGPDGSLIVLTRDGKVFRVDTGGSVTPIQVDNAKNGSLTVAGGETYLVTTEGGLVNVFGSTATRVKVIAGLSPGADGHMLVGSIQGPGPHVLIVSAGLLAIADRETGDTGDLTPLGTGDDRLGEPVEFRGKVYVPDYGTHKLIVVDVASKTVEKKRIGVPGTQPQFDLFVTGGKLWANDQYAQHLIQLDGSGQHDIDKGSGNGVKDDTRKPKPGTPPTKAPPGTGTTPANTSDPGSTGGGGTGSNGNGGGSGGGNGNGGGGGGTPAVKLVPVPRFGSDVYRDVACSQLDSLGLRCATISRPKAGQDTDTVIETLPGEGTKVPEGSTVTVVYVGPTQVPDVTGETPVQACQDLKTAELTCRLRAAGAAKDPSLYGQVATTEPAAMGNAKRGDTITVNYYDSFTMPSSVEKSATSECATYQGLSLELPDAQPVKVTCTAVAGNPAPKDNPGAANQVYDQNPKAGQVYKPGGAAVQLTYYSDTATLKDFRLNGGGYAGTAQDAVNECSQLFNCVLSEQTAPAVDNGAHAEWVGHVAAMRDANNNDIGPGQYKVGGATTVKIVAYTDQAPVPPVTGKTPDQACTDLSNAGFTCNRQTRPDRAYNTVLVQGPGSGATQGIGSPVTITYNDVPTVGINLYTKNGENVNIIRAADQPAPAGFTLVGSLGTAYPGGQGNASWQAREFTAANCNNHTQNIVYSHGTPDGCMRGGDPNGASAAGLIVPDNGTCNWGTEWLYRVSKKTKQADGTTTIDYTVVRSGTQLLNVPTQSPNAGYPDYTEGLGCIFPP